MPDLVDWLESRNCSCLMNIVEGRPFCTVGGEFEADDGVGKLSRSSRC